MDVGGVISYAPSNIELLRGTAIYVGKISTGHELEAGKIRRESDYWDAATFMKQVGLMPSQ